MAAQQQLFNPSAVVSYLGLPQSEATTAQHDPIQFLSDNLRLLPPHLAHQFSAVTTPKQRTGIPIIRNRRSRHVRSHPFTFESACSQFPSLWSGTSGKRRAGVVEGEAEKRWAETDFLEGSKKYVGKLGELLGNFEEEREAENSRRLRRLGMESDSIPEEDDDSEDDDDNAAAKDSGPTVATENEEDERNAFVRQINDRFIYGLLEGVDYNAVDWNECLDDERDRETEERWFDDESEEEGWPAAPS